MSVNESLDKVGLRITTAVGTMWCAIIFMLIALVSLPTVIRTGDPVIIVAWVAQTFLQLVLLSIIMVGQRLQGAKTEQKIDDTYEFSKNEFELAKEERAHQAAEMAALRDLNKDIHELLAAIKPPTPKPRARKIT